MNNMKQTQDDRTIQPFNCSTIQRVKAYAFTLAETLIVIGIIGVVAALTLPNLNHATGDKEKVTKVKKIYVSLTDAVGRAEAIYGPIYEWKGCRQEDNDIAACSKMLGNRITEFMKVSKTCGYDEGCFLSSTLYHEPSYYEGGHEPWVDNLYEEALKDDYTYILSDGVSIGFNAFGASWNDHRIRVDIDGPNKGKNQMGVDYFEFNYGIDEYDNTVKLGNLMPDVHENTQIGPFTKHGYCAAWIIKYDNLDYLKCPEDLNWDTQTSCK